MISFFFFFLASPFSLSLSYLQKIYDTSGSPKIGKILKNWSEEKYSSPAQQQKLGYIVLIELLSYQFASPVRWIETQDCLFGTYKVERLVEIGPGPTLWYIFDCLSFFSFFFFSFFFFFLFFLFFFFSFFLKKN